MPGRNFPKVRVDRQPGDIPSAFEEDYPLEGKPAGVGNLGRQNLLLVEMFPATHSRDSRVNAGLW